MDEKKDLFKKSEEFLQMLTKTKEFTEELLRENERLRFKIASQSQQDAAPTAAGPGHDECNRKLQQLAEKLKKIEDQRQELEQRFRQVEEENKDFANRYVEIEEQNNNLAN